MKLKRVIQIVLLALISIFVISSLSVVILKMNSKEFNTKLNKLSSFDITLTSNTSGYGSVSLDWRDYNYIDKNFKVYKSSNGSTYETVGIDYTSVKEVKVLQIYPETGSGQLKTWMETNNYGMGIIKVNEVSISAFNSNPNGYLKDSNGDWNYNVIFFGTWDANNNKDLSETSRNATIEFIKSGRGVILGHDTIYSGKHPYFNGLAGYFNISIPSTYSYTPQTQIKITKKGLFTTYPWYIGEVGTILTIPAAHPLSQYANGDIWLKFEGGTYSGCNNFYLTTYNNCAMIQTGHSSGAATTDEQKILANLIFYTNQLIFNTYTTKDSSAQDIATPNPPQISLSGTTFNWSAVDNGTTYSYYVESYNKNDTTTAGLIDRSNTKTLTVTTGVNNYRYIMDNSSTTAVTLSNGMQTLDTTLPINTSYKYLHIAAVDGAGNISSTSTVEIPQIANYSVKHYKQNIDGSAYNLDDTETIINTVGTSITPTVKTYTGFTSPSTQTTTIAADGSTVVTYNYTRNKYDFTLGSCRGVTTTGSTVTGSYYYEAPITLKAVVADGYTWVKWSNGTTSQNESLTMPANNLNCTPEVTVNTYTIEYNLNGGIVATQNPTTYTVETENFTLNNPTKIGYTFTGWTGSNGTTVQTTVNIAKGSTGNKTFTANWIANTNTKYTVIHQKMNLDGVTYTTSDTDNLTGTTETSVTPAVKTYIGFTSPSTQTTTIAADGSTVVTYNYTRNKYDFTLGSCRGVTTTGSTVTGNYYYEAPITLKAVVADGYTWSKWSNGTTTQDANLTMPASALTCTPQVTVNTYTIEYTLNGGTVATQNPTTYTVESENFTLNNPTKIGYTFTGWTGSNGTTAQTTVNIAKGSTGNKTFTANWIANTNTKYTVIHQKMNLDGTTYTTTDTENLTGTTGASITPTIKTYTGFTSPSTQTTTIAADGSTTVTYKYTRNKYDFTLGSCRGVTTTGSTVTGSYYYEAPITLKAVVADGYTWVKWSNGTTSQNENLTMPANNLNCIPEVTVNTYTIEYNLNGGIVATQNPTTYTVETENFTLNNPTKIGYTFTGWTGSNGTTVQTTVTIAKGSTGDKEYTANWTANADTKYIVEHYKQNATLDGYDLIETDNLTGTTDTIATAIPKTYIGFTENITCSQRKASGNIAGDGSLVLKLYYDTNVYNITLHTNEGTINSGDVISYIYGIGTTLPSDITKTGYTFNGWYDNEEFTGNMIIQIGRTEIGDKVFYAKWIINTYTVTFKDGDKVEKIQGVEYSSSATAPELTKPGYTLSWDKDFSNITEDITINTVWIANTNTPYIVEHYIRTTDIEVVGYTICETENLEGTTDTNVVAIPKEYEGFTIDNSYKETISSGIIDANKKLVLKLYYDRNTYNIKYELNGGKSLQTLIVKYTYGKQTILSGKAVKDGYVFGGWYDNIEYTGESIKQINTASIGDKTLYAKWLEPEEYYITSEEYNINIEEKYITYIKPNTDTKAFINNIDTNGTIKILNSKKEEVNPKKLIGTGCILQVEYYGQKYEYNLIIPGDIDGNGKITVTDLSMINQAIVGRITLNGVYKKAADLDYNNKISVTDLSMMNQLIVGKIIL